MGQYSGIKLSVVPVMRDGYIMPTSVGEKALAMIDRRDAKTKCQDQVPRGLQTAIA